MHPVIYRVLYIPGGAGFLPSTVWLTDYICLGIVKFLNKHTWSLWLAIPVVRVVDKYTEMYNDVYIYIYILYTFTHTLSKIDRYYIYMHIFELLCCINLVFVQFHNWPYFKSKSSIDFGPSYEAPLLESPPTSWVTVVMLFVCVFFFVVCVT